MTINTADARWQGNLKEGKGELGLANDAFKGKYSFSSRFEDGEGTNPEELIAAAHASCFSMAFSHQLAEAGFTPNFVHTIAHVTLGKDETGPSITAIELVVDADVPGISESQFSELGEKAKAGCPVSKALAGVKSITLRATLQKQAA